MTAVFALLAFLAIPMGMKGQTRAEVVAYTLDGTITGGTNGYATESEITQDDIMWMVTGNTTMNPWRIGGKNLDGEDRPLYSINPIADNITKVVVTNGTATLTVNSMTLIVSADVDFSNPTSTVTGSWAANSTTTFERPAEADWTNMYFKLVYNVTAGSSNQYAQFVKAEFYKQESGTPTCATPTFSPAAGTYTQAQNVSINCATEGATIYYTTDGQDPTTSSTVYSGAINVSTNTTVKAMATAEGYNNSAVATAEYAFITLEHAGTLEDPYTVADARAAIEANTGTQGVYATGIVSEIVTAYNAQFGNITYNISTDGTTASDQLQSYRGKSYNGEDFTSEDDIQVGDSVVVYGNLKKYGDTYEFEANNQLVSLVRPQSTEPSITITPEALNVNAEQHPVNYLNLAYDNIVVENHQSFTVHYYNAEDEEIELVSGEAWMLASVVKPDGVYQVLCAITANEGDARTGYFKVSAQDADGNTVYSNLVTVNQAAYNPAPSGDQFVRISSLDQLTDGSVVVIASRYNETANNYFAMKNAIGSKIQGTVFESVTSGTNEVLSSTISDDIDNYYWVVGVTSEGYTFTNASGDTIGYGSSTNFATNGGKTLWTVTSGTSGAALVQDYSGFQITNVNTNNRGIALKYDANPVVFGAYSTNNLNGDSYNFFLDFFVQTETVEPESYTLTINGYAAGSDDGYYLIASPVSVNPAEVQGMTEGEFDLYYFDESQDLEWINYKGENGSFNLEPGKGYLYAKKATTEGEVFSFELSGTLYDGTPITLAKVGNGEFQGWNLVGNPFADTAYINRDFYVMKEDGSEIITGEGNKIAPMQGFFVIAEQDGEELAISTETPSNTGSKIVVNVTQNRGNVIDRAIVRFGEGRQLPKFMMNPGNTKLFIAQADNEYAVVRSANEGEMPVSFKAAENGYYTLNIKAEDTEMGYLHLIDNMTGADVDLLSTPNYTFQANTTDYANRFCLVYAATTSINESASDDFAFFNGNEWVINSDGEATLQVIDMTGRVLSSQTVNGNTNLKLNQANGVYLLRLLQNNTVKNQKIVKE